MCMFKSKIKREFELSSSVQATFVQKKRDQTQGGQRLAFTFIMGPCELIGTGDGDPWCDPGVDMRGLNAAMLCDTPSAKMNCSRSSMLVRPLADSSHKWTWTGGGCGIAWWLIGSK